MRKLVEVIGANGTYAAVDPASVVRIYHESGHSDSAGSGCRIYLESHQTLFVDLPGPEVYRSLFGTNDAVVSDATECDTSNAETSQSTAYDEIMRVLVNQCDGNASEMTTAILAVVRSIIKRQRRGNFELTDLDREYNFAIDRMLNRFASPALPASGSPR